MTTLTTNRFLTKALRILCCAGALTACSVWASVITWQLSPKDLPQATYTSTALGTGSAPATDTSHAFLFETAPANEAASAQLTPSQSSKPADPTLFAASDAPARPATELDEALAGNFDEEFVSVPTVQFTSTAAAAASEVSMTSATTTNPAPVPEMSALFPIVGLIAAVSCTQILRRRRVAQQNAPRSVT
jgi:hypothetical protein